MEVDGWQENSVSATISGCCASWKGLKVSRVLDASVTLDIYVQTSRELVQPEKCADPSESYNTSLLYTSSLAALEGTLVPCHYSFVADFC